MTVSPGVGQKAPLGVGEIISESFSILTGNFFKVVALAVVPTLIGVVISGLVNGWGPALGLSEPEVTSVTGAVVSSLVPAIVQLMVTSLATALLVQAAYDAKLKRPLELGRYFGPAMSAAVPIAVLSLASGILMAIGFVFLIVPGLWIYAVFSVMPAAVVIERAGYGGLGRSADLTREYRWPIVGTTIVIGIINIAIAIAGGFVVVTLVGAAAGFGVSLVVGVLVFSLINAVGYGLGSISVALIYARLREIKEGASVQDIVSVFD